MLFFYISGTKDSDHLILVMLCNIVYPLEGFIEVVRSFQLLS